MIRKRHFSPITAVTRSFGFSLAEVTVALGIISFAIVALFALIPMGLSSYQASQNETRAAALMRAMESDLRYAVAGESSPIFGINVVPADIAGGAPLPSEALSVSLGESGPAGTGEPRFQARIRYHLPQDPDRDVIGAHFYIWWPGQQSDPTLAVGTLEGYATFLNPEFIPAL